jgi:hypothetical protein
MESEIRRSNPERLVYWYLRLNGFLLLEDFVVHPDDGAEQRTDADILGVRFQHRSENVMRSMVDDPRVAECGTYVNIIIGEVKRGYCALNGPWTRPGDANMQRVLRAIGFFSEDQIETAARSLYSTGIFQTELATCRLMAFGNRRGHIAIPDVPQVLFGEMIQFIHRRFREYERQKSAVGNWAWDGQALREAYRTNRAIQDFTRVVRELFDIPQVECRHGE